MKIKILIGDKGYVDFSSPIKVSESQRNSFINLLNSMFSVVDEEEVEFFRDWRICDKIMYPRTWSAEEYKVLLKCTSLSEAIQKLGRSGMAIIVQDGIWRPDYFEWCAKKRKDPLGNDMINTIKEFMKEREDRVKLKREKRKVTNRIGKLKEKLPALSKEIKTLKRKETDFRFTSIGIDARVKRKSLEEKEAQLESEIKKYEQILRNED